MSLLAMSDYVLTQAESSTGANRFTLWIDRVGAFRLCLGDKVTIGGPAAEGAVADISLLANLSRRHATFVRSGERYFIQAHSPMLVAGRPVHERADLVDGNEINLGSSVRLRFRQPSVMSGSARLDFLSDHRPAYAADGVVLLHDTCLLGPGAENHILCPGWQQTVLLFCRDGQVHCKARDDLFFNGMLTPGGGVLEPGTVVTGVDLRFRMEAAD